MFLLLAVRLRGSLRKRKRQALIHEAKLIDETHAGSRKFRADLDGMAGVVVIGAGVLEMVTALLDDLAMREAGEHVPPLPASFDGDLGILQNFYALIAFDLIAYQGFSGSTVEEHLGHIVADFAVGARVVAGLIHSDAMDLGDWLLQTIIPAHPLTQKEYSAFNPREVFGNEI
jgi:hypothetical protein